MKKYLLSLALVSSSAFSVLQIDTKVEHNGETEEQKQYWYVGDHIERKCGDVELDGTIREIIGDEVRVHFKIKKNGEVTTQDVKVEWGKEGELKCDEGTLRITLTDLKDQHPYQKQEAA